MGPLQKMTAISQMILKITIMSLSKKKESCPISSIVVNASIFYIGLILGDDFLFPLHATNIVGTLKFYGSPISHGNWCIVTPLSNGSTN